MSPKLPWVAMTTLAMSIILCRMTWTTKLRNFWRNKILKLHLHLRENSWEFSVLRCANTIPCYSLLFRVIPMECNEMQCFSAITATTLHPDSQKPKKPVVGSRAFQRLFFCGQTCHRGFPELPKDSWESTGNHPSTGPHWIPISPDGVFQTAAWHTTCSHSHTHALVVEVQHNCQESCRPRRKELSHVVSSWTCCSLPIIELSRLLLQADHVMSPWPSIT